MKKIDIIFAIIVSIILFNTNQSFGLQTYIGIKIMNLTDDPTASCVGESGYGPQGRIRALSSILPNHPIFFNLTKVSDNSIIWAGNITRDCFGDGTGCDYTVGDTILIPDKVDLTLSEDYKLFIDIDAIRIYLPLVSSYSFSATADDNYWTSGYVGSGTANEYYEYSISTSCNYNTNNYGSQSGLIFVANQRKTNLYDICMSDTVSYNCDERRFLGIFRGGSGSFRIYNKYDNLYLPNVGNFEFIFTFN